MRSSHRLETLGQHAFWQTAGDKHALLGASLHLTGPLCIHTPLPRDCTAALQPPCSCSPLAVERTQLEAASSQPAGAKKLLEEVMLPREVGRLSQGGGWPEVVGKPLWGAATCSPRGVKAS